VTGGGTLLGAAPDKLDWVRKGKGGWLGTALLHRTRLLKSVACECLAIWGEFSH